MVWRDVVSSSETHLPLVTPQSLMTPHQTQQTWISMKAIASQYLCFSRSQVRDPAYALLDSGATHVLLPGHMIAQGSTLV